MKAKSTGSPWLSWGNQPAEASENSPALPHPALLALGSTLPASSSCFLPPLLVAACGPEGGKEGPLVALLLSIPVPFAAQRGRGEGKEGRLWPPLMSWHRWPHCSVRSTEMLCLIWNSECISIKEGHKLYLACVGPSRTLVLGQLFWGDTSQCLEHCCSGRTHSRFYVFQTGNRRRTGSGCKSRGWLCSPGVAGSAHGDAAWPETWECVNCAWPFSPALCWSCKNTLVPWCLE